MKLQIHPSHSRGQANYGWLQANYSFSFAQFYDPSKIHFGMLRVLNDDRIAPAMGFSTHPHDNMEIITIPLEGSLKHKDSEGNEGIIRAGDVQVMSAGSGILHSEHNGEQKAHTQVLQLWIFPNKKNVQPRYDQKQFSIWEKQNESQTIVSEDGREGSLWIHQSALLQLHHYQAGESLKYQTQDGRGVYFFLIDGALDLAGNQLKKRDAISAVGQEELNLNFQADSKLLSIEVPLQ